MPGSTVCLSFDFDAMSVWFGEGGQATPAMLVRGRRARRRGRHPRLHASPGDRPGDGRPVVQIGILVRDLDRSMAVLGRRRRPSETAYEILHRAPQRLHRLGRVGSPTVQQRPGVWTGGADQGDREPIDPGVDIGHVHLKVADLDRALGFWRDVLGFEVQELLGNQAAFLSAGGYHHHIALNTWESKGGPPPPPGTTGLYHVAVRYPTRRALAKALRDVLDAGIRLHGASDHGVSEAIYLADPDGNGVELYRDRPRKEWPRRPDGGLAMTTQRLDIASLLSELDSG